MSKDKTVRLDQTFTSTRPDLEVNIQMPGAYIIRDGKQVPDLDDEAMANRMKNAERRVKSETIQNSEFVENKIVKPPEANS